MTWLVVCILCLMVYLGSLASGRGDVNDQWSRVAWVGMGAGLLIAGFAPNPFAVVLIGLASLNLIWNQPMSVAYRDKIAEGLVLAGVYVLCAPLMQAWMVPWVMGAMAWVGSWMGVQAIYGYWQTKDVPYDHGYMWGWVRFTDRTGGAPLAGQGNYNHAQSVGAMATAAVLGLWWMGVAWMAPLVLLTLSATLLCCEGGVTGRWVSQGWVHLGWVGMTMFGILLGGWVPWMFWSALAIGLLLWAHPWNPRPGKWYDSHRFATWNMAIRELWWTGGEPINPVQALANLQAQRLDLEVIQAKAAVEENAVVHNQITLAKQMNDRQQLEIGALVKARAGVTLTDEERRIVWAFWAHRIRVRLVGFGTGMWYPMTKWPVMLRHGVLDKEKKTLEGVVFLSAHNEYIEVWFEQGLIGLLALGGWVGYALHVTWSGGTVGRAVLLPVMALLSVAFCNFPFSLFREVEKGRPDQPTQFVGCPAMLVMSLMILLLVEAVR